LYERRKAGKMKREDIDQLLRSSDKNYAIPYDSITRIDVDKGGRLKSGSITIYKTTGETEKFRADLRKKMEDTSRLSPYLGEKLVTHPPISPAYAPPAPPPAATTPVCSTCGGPLTYIEQYKRWYCYKCQKYA
jgi:hypothetical protein